MNHVTVTFPPEEYRRICKLYPAHRFANPSFAFVLEVRGALVLHVRLLYCAPSLLEIEVPAQWCEAVPEGVRHAAAEIMAVLKKWDVGGCFLLSDAACSEMHFRLDPSWSIASIDGQGMLRLRAKREQFADQGAQVQAIASITAMLAEFHRLTGDAHAAFESALQCLGQTFDISHRASHYQPPET